MARPAVILATHRAPWPADSGSRIRTHRLARGLARRLDVTVVTLDGGPFDDGAMRTRADLESALPGVEIVIVPYHGTTRRNHWINIPRRGSLEWGQYATVELRAALTRLVHARPGAGLHLDDPGVGLAGIGLPAALTVFAPHNVEYRTLRQIERTRPVTRRLPVAAEWRKVAREERLLWRAADICLAVSDIDAAAMRRGGARRVELCPNGADPIAATRVPGLASGEPVRLLFVGAGGYWPYSRGLAWFVREALPAVRARGPALLDVVGVPPPEPVVAEGVEYHGLVPDVSPFYDRAHALVVPVFEGSGTRLKIVEAAMRGRPIISTTLGAEGLGLRPGEHYLGADDVDAFAVQTERLRGMLLGRPDQLCALLARARGAVEHLTWSNIAGDLADLYEREGNAAALG